MLAFGCLAGAASSQQCCGISCQANFLWVQCAACQPEGAGTEQGEGSGAGCSELGGWQPSLNQFTCMHKIFSLKKYSNIAYFIVY